MHAREDEPGTPMGNENMVTAVLGAVDAGDVVTFSDYLATDVVLRFANAPVVRGAVAVRAAVEQFLAGLRAIAHDLDDVRDLGDALLAHGTVTYTRLDGSTLTVPFATVWYLEQGLIREYLIFVDLSAL